MELTWLCNLLCMRLVLWVVVPMLFSATSVYERKESGMAFRRYSLVSSTPPPVSWKGRRGRNTSNFTQLHVIHV